MVVDPPELWGFKGLESLSVNRSVLFLGSFRRDPGVPCRERDSHIVLGRRVWTPKSCRSVVVHGTGDWDPVWCVENTESILFGDYFLVCRERIEEWMLGLFVSRVFVFYVYRLNSRCLSSACIHYPSKKYHSCHSCPYRNNVTGCVVAWCGQKFCNEQSRRTFFMRTLSFSLFLSVPLWRQSQMTFVTIAAETLLGNLRDIQGLSFWGGLGKRE